MGWAFGLAWHFFAPPGTWAFAAEKAGSVGLLGSLFGLGAALLLFMPFYLLRVMGAGDVKLMSVVGAMLGLSADAWSQILGVSICVLVAGGALSVSRMLLARRSSLVLGNVKLILIGYTTRLMGVRGPDFDPRTDSADRMPYAFAIGIGTTFYVVAKWAGWMTWL